VSDGVWEVRTDRGPGSPGSGVRELRAAGAAGRLAPELRALRDQDAVTVADAEDALGLSAYVAEALRFKRDRDRLLELVDWLQEEHGPVTEDERAAAFEELEDLDAEHERRRAAGKHDAGEAA